MRTLIMLACALALGLSSSAQKSNKDEIPAFGKVDKADLEMKECSFDEKADALVLLEDGQLDFIYCSGIEMKRRVRIKILSQKGLDKANIRLSYVSFKNEESIESLDAQTYNLDESGNIVVTKLEKKLVYEKKLSKKVSEKVFTFPGVKVGSIIEYKYKHIGLGLIDWYFQKSIPVKYSRYTVDFPHEIEVHTTPHCSGKYEYNRENTTTRVAHTYIMRNVPGFRDEPFIINEDYYRDRLETKVIAFPLNGVRSNRIVNWVQCINTLMADEDFGVQIKKDIPRTTELDQKLKTLSSPYDRMKAVYKYVQENMQWNEYYGIWALDGVKSAWRDKKGTVGEINLILVNLLKDAGLKVYPILLATHQNGIVNTLDAGTYDWPGFMQFDKVMAYVEIGGDVYVLDASQKDVPVHLIPPDVLQTQGLVIEKVETGNWGWKFMTKEKLESKNLILVNSKISAEGKMVGEAIINSFYYSRLSRLPLAKKGKDKFIETYVTSSHMDMEVEEVSFENLQSDSLPLIQKIKFTQPLNSSGDYSYFSANILSGLETNPFVADSRFSDVFFGVNRTITVLGNFHLPEGYEFEELPKNVRMIMPDTSITMSRIAQFAGDMLQTNIEVSFRKPFYPAAQYGSFQEFYLRLFELINEQFVIRKKK